MRLDYIVERVSNDLLCSICGDVLENAVCTPCGHYFCEKDLLEWFCHADGEELAPSQRCPQCNQMIEPAMVGPARVLRNLCGDLWRQCDQEHCQWKGPCSNYAKHANSSRCPGTTSDSTGVRSSNGGKAYEGKTSPLANSSIHPRRHRLHLEQQLRDLEANESLHRRQLADLVQTNKELKKELKIVKKESAQRLERIQFLERALLGEEAMLNLEAARTNAVREAKMMRES